MTWHKIAVVLAATFLLISAQALAADVKADQWKSQTGTWAFGDKVVNNDAVTANTNAYAAVDQKGETVTYEWTVKFVSTTFSMGPAAGMHIMASEGTSANRGQSYLAFQDEGFIRLYKADGSSLSKVDDWSTDSVKAGETYSYKVVVNTKSGLLQIYRNDKLVGSYTDFAPYKNAGFISLRTNGTVAEFTNIKVSAK